MPKTIKENRFTLSKSRNKTEDWQSEYNGKVHVVCGNCGDGVHAYLNGYINEGADGKYFSGPVKGFTPDEFPSEDYGKSDIAQESKTDEPKDDIPF